MTAAIVIGSGVIGAAVALELQRGGYEVTVVDRGSAAGAGSTSASSAIVRYTYSTRDAVLMAWEAAQRWFDWSEYLGVAGDDIDVARFIPCPNLTFRTPGYDPTVMLTWWDEFGIDYEELDADELGRRFPTLDIGQYFPPKRIDDPAFADDAAGALSAVLNPSAGFVDDPMLAAANLAGAARRLGAVFRFRAEVVSIDRTADGDAVAGVTLADGEVLRAPVVVNAAGPHSAGLNRIAGITDDMTVQHRPLRQEVFVAPAPPGFGLDDGGAFVADLDLGQYFRPQPGGTVLIGGTEAECDDLDWVDDPDSSSDLPTVEVWETAMLRFARRVPSFGVPHAPTGLAGLYDVTDDWVPIYDRSMLDGLFLACGTSGNQFKNAPIVGSMIRVLVDAVMGGHDHDGDPVRFVGPHTGAEIDLGAFSRRRAPAVTTGTVLG